MGKKAGSSLAAKHSQESPEGVDPVIRAKLQEEAPDFKLACAAAFQLASTTQRPPAEIGKAADLLEIRLVKCQLGLFGYEPEKKIVQPATTVDRALEEAIRAALQKGRLPCREAWKLAERFQVPKMRVSAACEALGFKVSPCQLGAF
jgi:hypothetical protein